jgi:hypothetical protein
MRRKRSLQTARAIQTDDVMPGRGQRHQHPASARAQLQDRPAEAPRLIQIELDIAGQSQAGEEIIRGHGNATGVVGGGIGHAERPITIRREHMLNLFLSVT